MVMSTKTGGGCRFGEHRFRFDNYLNVCDWWLADEACRCCVSINIFLLLLPLLSIGPIYEINFKGGSMYLEKQSRKNSEYVFASKQLHSA